MSYFADIETPAKWETITVCCPQAQRPQTGWNQRVNDVESRLPHHPPVSRRSMTWPYTRQPSPQQVPLPLFPIKSPSKTWGVGSLFFGTWVHLLPRTAGFLDKAIFPFTQHLSLSGSDSWGASGQTWVWWQNALLQVKTLKHSPEGMLWLPDFQELGAQGPGQNTLLFSGSATRTGSFLTYQTSARIKGCAK